MLIIDLLFTNEVKLMIVPIKITDEGEHYFEIPDQYLEELGWSAGDIVVWTQNDDGSFSLAKSEDSQS
ncbi:hypothetical protein Q8W13_06615 [Photobacterium damselae subsp. piscicida]|nr:hypothetical protein [Photobacterium damselae]MDP2516723.1 hypothetical protein [Photobacterium damselae subsp. piscicida]MDP2531140.1 hypothetical protein [Photobacterium damselae subsp. piscicida]MDP2543845.1 hypothetical protein [Photobacterium damselae subsp. piscicida]